MILLPEHDYWDPMRFQFEKIENVIVPKKKLGFLKLVHRIHCSIRINRVIRLPKKTVWVSKSVKKCGKNPVVLVVIEGAYCGLHEDWINSLKRKLNIIRSIYYCTNTIPNQDGKSYPSIEMLKKNYTDILCFDIDDARKFGLKYYKGIYAKYTNVDNQSKDIDFFFVGNNKGRFLELIKIYDELTKKGKRCLFYINGVKKKDIKKRKGIVYNTPLQYRDVINYVCRAKCLIEIIWNHRNNVSFRVWEGIAYGSYVLTNNTSAKELVRSENIVNYSDIQTIDVNFVENLISANNQDLLDSITPKTFINKIRTGEL